MRDCPRRRGGAGLGSGTAAAHDDRAGQIRPLHGGSLRQVTRGGGRRQARRPDPGSRRPEPHPHRRILHAGRRILRTSPQRFTKGLGPAAIAMAARLAQLRTKAAQAVKFAAKHGGAYYKEAMEKKKQYIVQPPTVEKCKELSKQLFYTHLSRREWLNGEFIKVGPNFVAKVATEKHRTFGMKLGS